MNKRMMNTVVIYTEDYNYNFFADEARWLHKEAENSGQDNFIYDVERNFDNTNIVRVTIMEPEMWVEVRDEWIEFDYSDILKGYSIKKSNIIRMEIEF